MGLERFCWLCNNSLPATIAATAKLWIMVDWGISFSLSPHNS